MESKHVWKILTIMLLYMTFIMTWRKQDKPFTSCCHPELPVPYLTLVCERKSCAAMIPSKYLHHVCSFLNVSGGMFLRSCEVMSSWGGVCGCERAAMDWNRRLTEFTQQWAFASQQPKFRGCNWCNWCNRCRFEWKQDKFLDLAFWQRRRFRLKIEDFAPTLKSL